MCSCHKQRRTKLMLIEIWIIIGGILLLGIMVGLAFTFIYAIESNIYYNYDIAKCNVTSSTYVRKTRQDSSYYLVDVAVYKYDPVLNKIGGYIKDGHFEGNRDEAVGNMFTCWYDVTEKDAEVIFGSTDNPTWELVVLIVVWIGVGMTFLVGMFFTVTYHCKKRGYYSKNGAYRTLK